MVACIRSKTAGPIAFVASAYDISKTRGKAYAQVLRVDGYGAITLALRHSDVWAAAACHSGDMGFELCSLPDMPAVLRALAGAENYIEKWWQQLEAAKKHPEGSGKVINALAMAASYDPDPKQFLGIRLPVTFDTCEIIEERWANWLRQDPVVAV